MYCVERMLQAFSEHSPLDSARGERWDEGAPYFGVNGVLLFRSTLRAASRELFAASLTRAGLISRTSRSVAFSTRVHGEHFTFPTLKDVLARANELRSGDRQAGLAARSMREMAAAKQVLADITLEQLYNAPSVPYEADEVTRVVVDGLDQLAYGRVKGWTVSRLREWLLDDRTTGEDISAICQGLTPEMIAAVAKLMSNMDLVTAGRKHRVVVRCNNTIGLAGRISSRLQPNHPTDEVEGVLRR